MKYKDSTHIVNMRRCPSGLGFRTLAELNGKHATIYH